MISATDKASAANAVFIAASNKLKTAKAEKMPFLLDPFILSEMLGAFNKQILSGNLFPVWCESARAFDRAGWDL